MVVERVLASAEETAAVKVATEVVGMEVEHMQASIVH